MSLQEPQPKVIPQAVLFLDATFADLSFGFINSFSEASPTERRQLEQKIANVFCSAQPQLAPQMMVTLSARSALQLFLNAKQYPRGSVILMSAINIPDISVVVRSFGLIPVPVDVHLDTLATKLDKLRSKIDYFNGAAQTALSISDHTSAKVVERRPRAVAFLFAQIYGRIAPHHITDDIVKCCRSHGLDVIEDIAESFPGHRVASKTSNPSSAPNPFYLGHPESDLVLWSFGAIKASTSFGCGAMRCPHENLLEKMRKRHESLPIQSASDFRSKLVKLSLVYAFSNVEWTLALALIPARAVGYDHKGLFVRALRGFPNQMLQRIQQQPCTGQLKLLLRRFETFDAKHYDVTQTQTCDRAVDLLRSHVGEAEWNQALQRLAPTLSTMSPTPGIDTTDSNVLCSVPGSASCRQYWLFPLLVVDPDHAVIELNRLGVDAYRGATQLSLVPEPQELPKSADTVCHVFSGSLSHQLLKTA